MKLTSMQKMIAVIAGIVVILVAIVVLLILPKSGELSTLETDLQTANAQVQQTKTLLAQLEQAKEGASLTQAELIALANQFPEKPELPSLVIELQDVSNAAGIRFERIGPAAPTELAGSQYSEIAITTRVSGNWSDILDFLRRVNRMTRSIRVTDVAIAPLTSTSSTSTEAPDVAADVSMRAYVLTMPSATASSTPPVAGQ